MKRTILITSFLVFNLLSSSAQIRTNEHSIRLHAGASNFWLGALGTGIMAAAIPNVEYEKYNGWVKYMPVYDWMVAVPDCSVPVGAPSMKPRNNYFGAPWDGVGDWYGGLEYRMTNALKVVGMTLDLDYRNKGCKIDGHKYAGHMVSPSLALTLRLGDFQSHVRPIIELGGGYDYVFGYSGAKDADKKALNNGFFAKASLGLSIPAWHSILTVQYQHDFYDFFDQNYRNSEGLMPFDGYKRRNAYVMVKLSHFWKR